MSAPKGVVIAQFLGWCEECAASIRPGQEIIRRADKDDWVHVECPETLVVRTQYQGTTEDEMGF